MKKTPSLNAILTSSAVGDTIEEIRPGIWCIFSKESISEQQLTMMREDGFFLVCVGLSPRGGVMAAFTEEEKFPRPKGA